MITTIRNFLFGNPQEKPDIARIHKAMDDLAIEARALRHELRLKEHYLRSGAYGFSNVHYLNGHNND